LFFLFKCVINKNPESLRIIRKLSGETEGFAIFQDFFEKIAEKPNKTTKHRVAFAPSAPLLQI